MRIVSLIPSATEILFAVGAGDDVVGVTFECDHPPRPASGAWSRPRDAGGARAAEIDDFVGAALAAGEDLYRLDADALADLDADLVVTQDLCAVCAVDVATVDEALGHLGCRAEVSRRPAHPRRRARVGAALGRATGHEGRRPRWCELEAPRAVASRVAGPTGRACSCSSGPTRPSRPGHWIPEMVTPRRRRARPRRRRHEVEPHHLGRRRRLRAGRRGVRAVRVRPRGRRHARRRRCATGSPACRCGPSTPTGTSPARGRGSSTASRRWLGSCTLGRSRRRRTPARSDADGSRQPRSGRTSTSYGRPSRRAANDPTRSKPRDSTVRRARVLNDATVTRNAGGA